MDLVLNIDKPPGPTSFAVVAKIRRLCRSPRTGHAGTLDPNASGVLLVLLGQATRIARYLEGLPKEYLATVKLGVETETDDMEGRVVSEGVVPSLIKGQVEDLLFRFVGEVEQIPPRYSALKRDGVPLYRLARQGMPVEPPPRKVSIHALDLVEIQGNMLSIRVRCSKGTYIRALARDIGRALGCGGALSSLTRTAVGPFTKEAALRLDGLCRAEVEAKGLDIDRALSFLPAVEIDELEAVRVSHGNLVPRSSGLVGGSVFRLQHRGKLLAMGREGQEGIRPECVFTAG